MHPDLHWILLAGALQVWLLCSNMLGEENAYLWRTSLYWLPLNWTLKETLTKLAIETDGDWVTLLPFALFQARNTPYKLNLTPFEILYGKPPTVY